MQNDATSTSGTYIPRYRLETHAQVEERVGRSRATLCAMRDPKDRRFDPSFPKPIPVGPPSNPYASIRFDASEIDEWIKSRMDMRPAEGEVAPTRPAAARPKCRADPP
jgi:predicted DNA-binding transcriptional regulator AlpA